MPLNELVTAKNETQVLQRNGIRVGVVMRATRRLI